MEVCHLGGGLWSFKTLSHSQLARPRLAPVTYPNMMVRGSTTLWNSKTQIKCSLLVAPVAVLVAETGGQSLDIDPVSTLFWKKQTSSIRLVDPNREAGPCDILTTWPSALKTEHLLVHWEAGKYFTCTASSIFSSGYAHAVCPLYQTEMNTRVRRNVSTHQLKEAAWL